MAARQGEQLRIVHQKTLIVYAGVAALVACCLHSRGMILIDRSVSSQALGIARRLRLGFLHALSRAARGARRRGDEATGQPGNRATAETADRRRHDDAKDTPATHSNAHIIHLS